jgi:hypothetical protein
MRLPDPSGAGAEAAREETPAPEAMKDGPGGGGD